MDINKVERKILKKRNINVVKKGILESNKKPYIVIEYTGKTKIKTIAKKFGKEYYRGFGFGDKQPSGLYRQVLWKRPVKKKTFTDEDMNRWLMG